MKKIFTRFIFISSLILIILTVNFKEGKTNRAAPPIGGLCGDVSGITCALIGCHYGLHWRHLHFFARSIDL